MTRGRGKGNSLPPPPLHPNSNSLHNIIYSTISRPCEIDARLANLLTVVAKGQEIKF